MPRITRASHLQVFLCLIILLFAVKSYSVEVTIFDVRKTLPLSDSQPVYKDYYINAGRTSGLKKGMVIKVQRRQNLFDHYQNKSPGDLLTPVGEVRIIHVQKDVSVAREYKIYDSPQLPVLKYNGLMVGDQLDMDSARNPSSASAGKRGVKSKKTVKKSSSKPKPKPKPQKPAVVLGSTYGPADKSASKRRAQSAPPTSSLH